MEITVGSTKMIKSLSTAAASSRASCCFCFSFLKPTFLDVSGSDWVTHQSATASDEMKDADHGHSIMLFDPKKQPKHCITAHAVPQAVPQQFYGVAAELVLLGGPLSSGCVSRLNTALSQNIRRCSVQPSAVLTSQLICVQIQSMCFCSVNKTV